MALRVQQDVPSFGYLRCMELTFEEENPAIEKICIGLSGSDRQIDYHMI